MKIIALLMLMRMATMNAASSCECAREEPGCIYNNQAYADGTYTFSCFILTCRGGRWNYTGIDLNCPLCYSCNDPHFKTFDNSYYDWHGKCNYTLSQPYDCKYNCSYFPKYGVYADFGDCYPGSDISCVDSTTYKVDPNTAVSVEHSSLPTTIKINGNTITVPTTPTAFNNCFGSIYPVLIWRDNTDCVYIVGPIYTVKVCGWCVFVYYGNSAGPVGGLCGYYTGDGNQGDDYLMRDSNCQVSPTVPPFAISWTTQQQKDEGCCHQDLLNPPNIATKMAAGNTDCYDQYYEECRRVVTEQMESQNCRFAQIKVEEIINDCVEDCCEGKYPEKWLENARNVTRALCDDELMKKPGSDLAIET